uniref:Uncharacterized protein n=1 Tax=Setaria italica TaxID=4555 RepID=K4A471_SETIT
MRRTTEQQWRRMFIWALGVDRQLRLALWL